jgi:hypothetical protein
MGKVRSCSICFMLMGVVLIPTLDGWAASAGEATLSPYFFIENEFVPSLLPSAGGFDIYFFFLSLFYMIISKVVYRFGGGAEYEKPAVLRPDGVQTRYFRWACTGLIPLFWYGLITLGVPLVNGAWQADATRFAEHSGMVLTASCAVLGALFLLRIVGHKILIRLRKPLSGWKKHEFQDSDR